MYSSVAYHLTLLSTAATSIAAGRGVLGSLERKIDDASGGIQQHEPARNAGKREKEKDGPRRRGFSLFMRFLNSNRVNMGN